ncbi:MAG: hypothetical protein IPJ73_01610 [Zoogloea sp.]|nr:hypothetical protein [Zoogloea sp.]
MTDKKIDSLKHKKATRARIPSKEEAGFESNEPSRAELPLNPVTTRGKTRNSTGCKNTVRTMPTMRSTWTSARSIAANTSPRKN